MGERTLREIKVNQPCWPVGNKLGKAVADDTLWGGSTKSWTARQLLSIAGRKGL